MTTKIRWMEAGSIQANPEYHSTPLNIVPILLALSYRKTAVIGWFYAGLINEFRVEGSPSKAESTHWAPLPDLP